MSVTAKKINGANAVITATIDSATIDQSISKIAKEYSKTANVDGFRKGKVPVAKIKAIYGDKLTQDAESEALRAVLDAGVAELKIDASTLIGEPNVTKFDKKDDIIEVEIKVAMRPEINLGDYAKFVPDVKKPKITKKAVTERVKELAQAQAQFQDAAADAVLEDTNNAVINFEGSIDGEIFPGGTAEDFSLTIGSGQFIPGFEEQLVGMKRDEEKTIEVPFPADYQAKELAGKVSSFKVKLTNIQTKEKVRVDQKLAEKMLPGEENVTVDILNEKIEEQLASEELTKLYNDDLKPQLMEALVKEFTFDLPEFIVEQEMDNALNKKAQGMTEDEINEIKDNADKVQELRETFRDDAVRSVKATFIVDQLAIAENVKVEEQEVQQTIYYEAMQMGQDPQATLEQYQKNGYLPAIQMAMVEDRVLAKLLNAKMEA